MLELPLAVDFHVVLFVARRQPYRIVALAHREGSEEIPLSLGAIAAHLDDWIHHVVLREADAIAKALEQLANRRVPLVRADVGPFPDAVLGKQGDDLIG